jgi:hypothetical protein
MSRLHGLSKGLQPSKVLRFDLFGVHPSDEVGVVTIDGTHWEFMVPKGAYASPWVIVGVIVRKDGHLFMGHCPPKDTIVDRYLVSGQRIHVIYKKTPKILTIMMNGQLVQTNS